MSSENALTEFAVWTSRPGCRAPALASLTMSQIVPGADAPRGSRAPCAARLGHGAARRHGAPVRLRQADHPVAEPQRAARYDERL